MQSGYGGAGGVSEIQQFMVEGCSPSLFSISTAANASPDLQAAPPHHHKFLPHPPPPPPPATHFSHFHSTPITQHFFHPQFHLFHHPQDHHETQQQQRRLQLQRLGLDQDSGPENSGSPTPMMGGGSSAGAGGGASGSAFLTAAKNFKLAVNESSSRDGLNVDSGVILQGDDVSDTRVHPWQREEESSIKEPFWRPLDIDYTNRDNKRCKEKQPEMPSNYCKKIKGGGEHDQGNSSGSNYKLFSELEAICKPGGGGGGFNATNQTGSGSGSGLTGENPLAAPVVPGPTSEQHVSTVNHGSETSTGDQEAPVKKPQKSSRRKRRRKHQLSSIAAFFEGLLKQLMEHQEGLHCKFLEVMERREQERSSREEAWRKQEAAKSSREATARAQERALVTTRETAIISFLEKINGESLNLPARPQLQSQLPDESQKEDNTDDKNSIEPPEAFNIDSNRNGDGNTNPIQLNTRRWPKAEVQTLIRVRSSLESRFQEPGLKGPLWEEVSSMMSSMGYNRSAKRCKEKWENINKYFRKTKDSGKKRPQHSKTCPYFLQLDQFYSKSLNKSLPPPSTATSQSVATTTADPPTAVMEERRDSSELLDAIVVSNDNPSIKFPEMSSLSFDFNGNGDRDNEASGSMIAGKGLMEIDRQPVAGSLEDNNHEDDKDEDEEEV